MIPVARLDGGDSNEPIVPRLIRVTEQSLRARARLFRSFVLANAAIVFLAAILAVAIRSLVAAAVILILIPLTGAYFLLDTRILYSWQQNVLGMWESGTVNLKAIRSVLRKYPFPLRRSVAGMISILPAATVENEGAPQRRQTVSRKAAQELRKQQYRTAIVLLLLSAVAVSLLLVTLHWHRS